jgi:hypothetical protein
MESNLICEVHNSPIGGVCGDVTCTGTTQLMCIKCIVDPKSCIRVKSHKVISVAEFFSSMSTIGNQSEVIDLYAKLRSYDSEKQVERLRRIAAVEKNDNDNMKKQFDTKLDEIFKKEQQGINKQKDEKLQKLEEVKIALADRRKGLVQTVTNDGLLTRDAHCGYKYIIQIFLQEYQARKVNEKEAYVKLTNLITDLRRLIMLGNDDRLLELLGTIASYITFSNKHYVIDSAKFDIQHLVNFNKDVRMYLSTKEKLLNDLLGSKLPEENKIITAKFDKTVKETKLPSKYIMKEYKLIEYIQNYTEEDPIFISEMNLLCLHNKEGMIIYNTLDKSKKLSVDFMNSETPYEKKLYHNKFICVLTSLGNLITINLTNLTTTKYNSSVEFKTKYPVDHLIYDVYFGDGKPKSIYINTSKGSFITGHLEDSGTISFVTEKQELENPLLTKLKLVYNKNGTIDYIIRSTSLSIDVYTSSFEKHHNFRFKGIKKETCVAFEYNTDSTGDILIFSLWSGGVMDIYSVAKKKLVKEISVSFKRISVYCLTLFGDKKLFVGGSKKYYIVDLVDSKKNSKAYKLDSPDDKVLKIITENPNSFSCMTKNSIYHFQKEK